MLAVSLNFIVFLYLGLATAFPVQLSPESALQKSSRIPRQDEIRADAVARAVPSNKGNRIFASAQWERSAPSRVRGTRDPQSTIFNHLQWVNPDLEDTSPRSTTLIFAHDQWEDNEAIPEEKYGQSCRRIPSGCPDSRCDIRDARLAHTVELEARQYPRDKVRIFEYQQWERRDLGSEVAKLDVRKDIATGPVFFAHGQWEESDGEN
ncbi:hypothetical protein C8F04DRAFT_86323 [Mycena alexandri]|uniref:Uncharacterized protein n=1 Tax=Mycena alexandri TaxID=1745969 RepID=A0AAD6TC79_9AGAR|nr:hypothetical protein C8F04DRAFT_86323 [Mycena alexandri]